MAKGTFTPIDGRLSRIIPKPSKGPMTGHKLTVGQWSPADEDIDGKSSQTRERWANRTDGYRPQETRDKSGAVKKPDRPLTI